MLIPIRWVTVAEARRWELGFGLAMLWRERFEALATRARAPKAGGWKRS